MPEYRPCIVIEYKTKLVPSRTPERSILDVKKESIEHKALFHQWVKRVFPRYEETPFGEFVTRKFIGTDEVLIAVVEYEDGTIYEHLPQEIRFADGESERIFKNKKDGWNKLTEDTDSYPEAYENVLFRASDGEIYYGCCDTECRWGIKLENELFRAIKDVVEWKRL